MTPREHFRKMPALNEQGMLDEKHLYQMANGIGAGGHQEFRHQQEMLMRNQMMVMNPHSQIMGTGQQRMQGLAVHFEPRFLNRNSLPASEILSSPKARQLHLGSRLGTSVQTSVLPNRAYPGAGYNILPPEAMDSMFRRQELIHKQNLASPRLKMNGLLHQKELENAHLKGLLGMEVPFLYPGISTDAITFHNRQRPPKGQHPSEAFLHQNALGDFSVGNGLLVTSNPYPPISTVHRDRCQRGARRATSQKSAEGNLNGSKGHSEGKQPDCTSATAEEEKETGCKYEAKADVSTKPKQNKMDTSLPLPLALSSGRKECEQRLKKHSGSNENCPEVANGNTSYAGTEKDMSSSCAACDDKYIFPSALPLPTIPYGFQLPGSSLMASAGSHAVFVPKEDISVEAVRKWTVDDVSNFIGLLSGCSDYAQTFKDHAIDGETLPLLTEGHLPDMMGLKLGPALKIQSRVSRRIESALYVMNLPLSAPLHSAVGETVNQAPDVPSPVTLAGGVGLLGSPCGREQENLKVTEQGTVEKTDKPPNGQCNLQNF